MNQNGNILEDLLQNIKIQTTVITATKQEEEKLLENADVLLWLNKIGWRTRHEYQVALIWFLKCVNIQNPSQLLDLKMEEDPRRRYFPAERLVETWAAIAKQKKMSSSQIKKVLDTVRSFFKHNRIPLVQVTCTYKVKPKEPITVEQLRQYREGFNFYGKIIFDFLLSVPLRDGQFQVCPNCGEDFLPRWRHITTYPTIETYSPFAIKPEKGHESEKYDSALMQVCYLTETAAYELNLYRKIKEKALRRALRPDEYIFTHQKRSHMGTRHVTPILKGTICAAFQQTWKQTGIQISPHLLRSWDNSILASRGIDKQLRDIYLGHSCHCEQGYVLQMIPQWQQAFRQAKAMESIDIAGNFVSPHEAEARLWQIQEQQEEISRLEKELNDKALSNNDYALSRLLLRRFKQGQIKVIEKA